MRIYGALAGFKNDISASELSQMMLNIFAFLSISIVLREAKFWKNGMTGRLIVAWIRDNSEAESE
ncbi:MAG: hypothetical protein A3E57_06410 [Candidatus Muproteobacteria bacterium RIFCSPHIGHO2_12_FULL_60_33]|nr:MAG: hypothetical protein A3E57_06410 [Candidatus Muproteobacteria bacterium RIFCSPHIGHO2_12_FULL_60_33]